MQAAPGAALPAPCARSARLRRRLEGETLARSYPRLPGDGSVLHIAYLRAPAEQGASDSNRVRATLGSGLVRAQGDGDLFDAKGATDAASVEADLQFFLRLAREQSCEIEFVEVVAQDGSESPSDSDCDEESSKVDSVGGVNGRSSPTTGLTTIEYRTDANGEAYSVQRDQLAYDMTCRDFVGVLSGVTCRFQQFGEYSSLTLSLPRAFGFAKTARAPPALRDCSNCFPTFICANCRATSSFSRTWQCAASRKSAAQRGAFVSRSHAGGRSSGGRTPPWVACPPMMSSA